MGVLAYRQHEALSVQALPHGAARQFVAGAAAHAPRWSPSGAWLLYQQDSKFHLISQAGSTDSDRALPDDVQQAAWAPTADVLAYTKIGGGLFLQRAGEWRERTLLPGMRQAGASDGSYTPGVNEEALVSFIWSPDGQALAYTVEQVRWASAAQKDPSLHGTIWRINADGTHAQRLFDAGTNSYRPLLAAWSPDGRLLLAFQDNGYSASILADGVPLLAIPATGGKARTLSHALLDRPGAFTISPDSTSIVMAEGEGRESTTRKSLALVSLANGFRNGLHRTRGTAWSPAWSPDGQSIAFVATAGMSGAPAQQRHLYLVQLATNKLITLTSDDAYRDECPQWSADGAQLLFVRVDAQQHASLWLIRADGSGMQEVVPEVSLARGALDEPLDCTDFLAWWQAAPRMRAIATPAILADGNLLLPLRQVVEGLGGTVLAHPATQTVTIALGAQTQLTPYGTDATFSTLPVNSLPGPELQRRHGITYVDANEFAGRFGVAIHRYGEQHVTLGRLKTGKYLALSVQAESPGAPRPGNYPLIHVDHWGASLVGGSAQGHYLGYEAMAEYLRGGENYRLYKLPGFLWQARGSRPSITDSGATGRFLEVHPAPELGKQEDVLGLHADWHAMPRLPHMVSLHAPQVRRLARAVLRRHGLPNVTPHITQAMRIDLDGDGREELLISATTLNPDYTGEGITSGDYSFVAVQRGEQIILLNGEFYPAVEKGTWFPSAYHIAGVLDVDGDGRLEVITGFWWWEAGGNMVFRIQDGQAQMLFGNRTGDI